MDSRNVMVVDFEFVGAVLIVMLPVLWSVDFFYCQMVNVEFMSLDAVWVLGEVYGCYMAIVYLFC